MPILLAILAALGGGIWWWIRSNPDSAVSAADDAVTVLRNAPRKIAFRRQTREHPVAGIDDPRLAIATLGQAFIGLDDLPTRDQRARLMLTLRRRFGLTAEEAEEVEVLARWLETQCGGASPAISRVGRRLAKIDGGASWDDLTEVLAAVAGDDLSRAQHEAIADLRVIFRRR